MAARAKPPSPVRNVLAARARDPLLDLVGTDHRLVELDVDAIEDNPAQPRRQIDEAALAELAASIDRHGLLQPIVVTPAGCGYRLVAGQRRLLAHRQLGRARIAALIVDGAADELALIENLQREDLAPLDEAEALAALKERHGYSLDELGRVLAKGKSTLSELLSLNGLPDAIKAEVRKAERPVGKSLLIEIARRPDEEARLSFWRQLQSSPQATVRAARAAKAAGSSDPLSSLRRGGRNLLGVLEGVDKAAVQEDRELRELLRQLRQRLSELLQR